jgi:hypothetical protein
MNVTTENTPALAEVLKHAKPYAAALQTLEERVQNHQDEQLALSRRNLPGIRAALEKLGEARCALVAALAAAADSFAEPNQRTLTVFGLKLGFRKNIGRLIADDDARVIERIARLMPDKLDQLAPSVRSLDKKALANLTAAELKRLGCELAGAGDEMVIKSATSDVEKLVRRLVTEDETMTAYEKGKQS